MSYRETVSQGESLKGCIFADFANFQGLVCRNHRPLSSQDKRSNFKRILQLFLSFTVVYLDVNGSNWIGSGAPCDGCGMDVCGYLGKTMKRFYRIMLGRKSIHAEECSKAGFIGADFGINQDLTNDLPENWKQFNQRFIPIYLKDHLEKTKGSAGLACGALWTIAKGLQAGDVVLCPNGEGEYMIGEVTSGYMYRPDEVLPHRRNVKWFNHTIQRSEMSQSLQNSTGSIGTVSEVTKYADELEKLVFGKRGPSIIATDPSIEDPSTFALEEHLEEFLVLNWKQTDFGKNYDIFEEDGEVAGQQYPTDTGPIDILAISKDRKELLVVELKKGRASDSVVGQIQRYMGFIQEEVAEHGQTVRGAIIASEDHLSIRRALQVTKNIEFYKYQVSFKLAKV